MRIGQEDLSDRGAVKDEYKTADIRTPTTTQAFL